MKNIRLTNEQLDIVNVALFDYKDKMKSMETEAGTVEKIEDLIKEVNGFSVDYFNEYLKQRDKKERLVHVVKALIGEEANSVLKVILNDD